MLSTDAVQTAPDGSATAVWNSCAWCQQAHWSGTKVMGDNVAARDILTSLVL